MNEMQVGQIVRGIVHLVKEFGFFVRLSGDHFGLVLLPNFSDDLPVQASSLPRVGEEVTCVILAIDSTPEGLRIALSMKASELARVQRGGLPAPIR